LGSSCEALVWISESVETFKVRVSLSSLSTRVNTQQLSLNAKMEAVQDLVDIPKNFLKASSHGRNTRSQRLKSLMQEGMMFLNRCTKPSQKEYVQICKSVAIGFAIMGFIGFFVKLIHIPINTVLVT
jgi:protein transport protein SEC61 subunit gamma-like protein